MSKAINEEALWIIESMAQRAAKKGYDLDPHDILAALGVEPED